MLKSLEQESEKLARSWLRHEAAMLRDYLVAGVEDPRINLQSILSRHFLIRALSGDRFQVLMKQECRFGAVMNWLRQFVADEEESLSVLHALRTGADNAEGMEVPRFVLSTFRGLPADLGGIVVPNYIESFLAAEREVLNTFCPLWRRTLVLADVKPRDANARTNAAAPAGLSVLEPGCGSANDYRFLDASGIAPLIDYTGFDLCRTNVENARVLFPNVRFQEGNLFSIDASNASYDLCFLHDVLEHLSLEGLQSAVDELCRVTRLGLCIGCFNVDEIGEHVVVPVEDYYWNRLSLGRLRQMAAQHGFGSRAIHIGTFLREQFGCGYTHNPNAYTLILWRG
jgi:SAM-dependent methyltransferase